MQRMVLLILLLPQILLATSYLNIIDTNYLGKRPCSSFNTCSQLANTDNEYARTTLAILLLEGKNGAPKDVPRGIELLRESTENDYHLAEAVLGLIYKNGDYLEKSPTQSATWMLKSAIQGFALAQYYIANMYLEGYGVNKNLDLAVHWIKQAASRQQLDAMKQLGIMYIQGKGVKQNSKRGEAWLARAICDCSNIKKN